MFDLKDHRPKALIFLHWNKGEQGILGDSALKLPDDSFLFDFGLLWQEETTLSSS